LAEQQIVINKVLTPDGDDRISFQRRELGIYLGYNNWFMIRKLDQRVSMITGIINMNLYFSNTSMMLRCCAEHFRRAQNG
jgi:hypothetical protein